MNTLESIQPIIQSVISVLSAALKVDAAVIDNKYHLVASTKTYLKYKGRTVHGPFVKKVFELGEFLVSKPGYTQFCEGCRFQKHCPATVEILNCIKLENMPLGVISLTSFTPDDQIRLNKNYEFFEKLLNEASKLIATIVKQKEMINEQIKVYEEMLQTTVNLADDGFICVNNQGTVIYSNRTAQKLFNTKELKGQSLSQILPANECSKIFNGFSFSNIKMKNEYSSYCISGTPVKVNNNFAGAVLQLNPIDSIKEKRFNRSKIKSKISLEDIKGNSASIRDIKAKVKKIANTTSTVLITGETGTGKELFARAIHYCSNRCNSPFIAINCAGIPETLLESELFGYEEGAFTGAKKGGKPGRFELANGGTIFLDEIGDMPLHLQAKLLRVLQERSIERIGSTHSIPIDVRIIAATNQNIEEMVKQNKFREDLYYRLNVIHLHIPPLRARKSDIKTLALFFLEKYSLLLGKKLLGFSNDTMELLISYSWPGNIRELENTIEYAVNMETEEIIRPHSLPEKFRNVKINKEFSLKAKIEDIERDIIKTTLDKHGWDLKGKFKAAKELNIGVRTLYRKIKKFNLVH